MRRCFRRCFGSLSAGSCGRRNRRAAVEEETAIPLLLRPFSNAAAAVEEEWQFPLLLRPFSIAAAAEEESSFAAFSSIAALRLTFCIVNFSNFQLTRRSRSSCEAAIGALLYGPPRKAL